MANLDFSKRGTLDIEGITATPTEGVSRSEAAARGFVQEGTFGFADELISVLGAAGAKIARPDLFEGVSQKQLEKKALKLQKAKARQAQEAQPGAYLAGQIGGAVTGGLGLAKSAPKVLGAPLQQAGLGGRALKLGTIGAVEGAFTGAGTAEGGAVNRALGAAQGAALGAPIAIVGGEAARGVVRGVGGVAGKLRPRPEQIAKTPAEQVFTAEVYPREELLEAAPAARQVMEQAERQGITVTPGEAFGDPNLLAQQGVLRDQPGQAAVRGAQLAEQRQVQQLPQAFEKQIAEISPVASPDVAGRQLIAQAETVERNIRRELSEQARPFYEKAHKTSLPDEAPILKNERVIDYLKQVRKDFPELNQLSDNNLEVLDEVKKLMDGDIKSASSVAKPDYNTARLITKVKRKLIDKMDDVSPDYKKARKIYAEGAPEIEQIVKGRLGKLSGMKALKEPEAPKELIAGSIEQTEELVGRLPQTDIKAGTAALMQRAREDLRGEAFSGIEKKIFPTPKQREQYKVLLGEDYEPTARLMDIFKRVGEGQRFLQNSVTQPKQRAQRAFSEKVADVVNEASTDRVNLARRVMRTITGSTPEMRAAEDAKFYNDMADILLTPRGLEIIEDLARLKPSIEQARRILGMVQLGAGTAGAGVVAGAIEEGQRPSDTGKQRGVPDFSQRGQLIQ